MTLQWLAQGQVTLYAGHYYRARFLIPKRAPGDTSDTPCPITNTRLYQIKTLLSDGLGNWDWTVLKIPDPSYFDKFPPAPWPGNMREVPPALNPNGLCPVWVWAKGKQKVTVPLETIRGVLSPLGGVLLNFWNQSSGLRIYDVPVTSLAPGIPPTPSGQLFPGMNLLPGSPGTPPAPTPSPTPSPTPTTSPGIPPILIPGGGPVSPPPIFTPGGTPPASEEKKTSPAVYVVVGALAIGAIAVLMGSESRGRRSNPSRNPRVVVTYEVVTPESAEFGDVDDRGFVDEDGYEIDPDEDETLGEATAKYLRHDVVEASSSHFHPGIWYIGEASPNYRTGAERTYSYHLKDFTEAEQRDVYNELKRMRRV